MLGWILDLSGGMSATGWGLAFLHVAVGALVGQIDFTALRPRDVAGDQPLSHAPTRTRRPRREPHPARAPPLSGSYLALPAGVIGLLSTARRIRIPIAILSAAAKTHNEQMAWIKATCT